MLLLFLKVGGSSDLGPGLFRAPAHATSLEQRLRTCNAAQGFLWETSAFFALKDDVPVEEGNGISVTH